LAAWLGLVPREHSTGGKPRLLGMGKRGDVYLRKLSVHGARHTPLGRYQAGRPESVAQSAHRPPGQEPRRCRAKANRSH
jgi:transposase